MATTEISNLEANKPAGAPPSNVAAEKPSGFKEILKRWKREGFINRGSLALRALGLIFSLLSFLIMAGNEHGDWRDFHKYEEYRYVLGIAILSTLYNGGQVLRQVQELYTGKDLLQRPTAMFIDFIGDQIMSYLLVSAASSAVPLTNRMREGADNRFTDSSAASISMAFFAFFSLALSSLISGYNLSTHSYI